MNIEWKDSYCIGNDAVDRQHRHVFELASELDSATTKPARRLLVMRLYQHVRGHFKEEELLMQEINFPAFAGHVLAHDKILSNLNRVSLKVADDDGASEAIHALLIDWALNHIATADAELARYIQAH